MENFKINWHRSINFGDQLNPYLINHFLGYWPKKYEIWNERLGRHEELTEPHIMLLGSILNEANEHTTVVGAGFVSDSSCCIKAPKFLSVRGKLTLNRAQSLYGGIGKVFLGDPALCLPKIFTQKSEKKYKFGIIPHLIDEDFVRSQFNGYRIISLRTNSDDPSEIERIISEINECEVTISSSLHGLLISHVYEIPSLWVEFSDRVIGNGFKFRDYFSNHVDNLGEFPNFEPINLKEGMGKYSIKDLIDLSLRSNFKINEMEMEENYMFYKKFFEDKYK
jgi:pyruvyltransferase